MTRVGDVLRSLVFYLVFYVGTAGILSLGRRFAGLGAGMVSSGALIWSDWLLLALVPLLATGLAMLTARLTVMHALRRML